MLPRTLNKRSYLCRLQCQILHGPLSHKTEAEVLDNSITPAKKNKNGRKRQRQKPEGEKTVI
jgi:hypothetical protein